MFKKRKRHKKNKLKTNFINENKINKKHRVIIDSIMNNFIVVDKGISVTQIFKKNENI
jgi:hypothetical protein